MLTLENLSFDMNDEKEEVGTIENINFTVNGGKFVVITGPSGDGKSTTAKLIMGVECPTEGRILSDGQDITDMSITDRVNLGIGFAFRQPVCFGGTQVIDLLCLAARKKLTVSEACQYLTEVGLCAKDYVNRKVNTSLSGGELKRIEITTVIVRTPKLSVFDGPEADIDLRSFRNLTQVFECMRQNTNGPILIISYRERILNIADKIMVIVDDKMVSQGTGGRIMLQIMGAASAVDACNKFYETVR